jgi:hypothetical protein
MIPGRKLHAQGRQTAVNVERFADFRSVRAWVHASARWGTLRDRIDFAASQHEHAQDGRG